MLINYNLLTALATISISTVCELSMVNERQSSSVMFCPTLKRFDHGKVKYRQRRRFAKFTCDMGYSLVGDRYSSCVRGRWDSTLPKCVRSTCSKVKPPPNGLIYPSYNGGVLNFFCKPGYDLKGPNVTYCTGKQWDSNGLPSCILTGSQPSKRCDFESDDLCGWTTDLNHDFDWIRKNFQTPSGHIGTGPSYDHTKGEDEKDGYYMYIESSSQIENDTARILSPIYEQTLNDTCFEFYYHMYGATIGQLRVYLKQVDQNWTLNPENASFWKSGNQGDVWKRGFFKVGPISNQFQVIIEGVRGKSYTGDIAVDDVQLVENCRVYTDDFITESNDYMSSTTEGRFLNIESCEHNCENDHYIPSGDSFQLSCSCVGSCVDSGMCCPDYFTFCMTESSPSTDVSAIQTETSENHIYNLPPSTTEAITNSFTNITKATPTTPTKATSRMIKTTKTLINTTKIAKITKKYVIKTTSAAPKKTTIKNMYASKLSTYSTVTDSGPVIDKDTKKQSDVIENKIITAKNEMKKSLVLSERTNIVIICTVSLLLISVVSVACIVKRYYLICASNKLRQSQNFDSQSDVRFLTSDEILDFTLRSTN